MSLLTSGCFVFLFFLTVSLRAAAVGRLLPLRGNRTLFYPSLYPTYLCWPCSDLAIQSRLSDPWRNTSDWYLTAWCIKSGGLGLSFVSLHFCYCQYVTQSLSFGNSVTLSFVAIDAWRRFSSTETVFCCTSVANKEMNKVDQYLSHFFTLCTPSVLEGKQQGVGAKQPGLMCFSVQVLKPWAQTCAEDPAGALRDYAAFLIFLTATATRVRHFRAAFIFKCKTCNGRR